MSAPLLQVRNLTKSFPVGTSSLFARRQNVLTAVDGIDFDLPRGRTLGLVGESGCGKSTTARLILRLIEPTFGTVTLNGVNVLGASPSELLRLRREMQLVFQDPLSSLNPRMSAGINIGEPMRFHGIGDRRERYERTRELLEVVGLRRDDFDRYPHEFSGGQCQRIAIARALILRPKLIVFDEPVSALDVSIRAQILKLLMKLQQDFELTYMFISHDLSVIKRICDDIAVMYLGRIVELAGSEQLYRAPQHPYSQALLQSIPTPDPTKRYGDLGGLEGDVPSPIDPPLGCRFHTRCPKRMEICDAKSPALIDRGSGQRVACHLYD
mgnify:FL=1